ncbi:MAG: hypothetical protein IJU18_02985, partial [Oscillospiraceae bacterium]|nr:hypothetical protein [Oscillospiraceae bacterium]
MTWLKKLAAAAMAAVLVFSGLYISAPKAYAESATEKDGQFFAGYYEDSEYTVPSESATGYEKWVDTGVL